MNYGGVIKDRADFFIDYSFMGPRINALIAEVKILHFGSQLLQ